MEFFNTNNNKSEKPSKHVKLSGTGKFLITLTGGAALGLTIIAAPFISPALRKFCLPYIPATTEQINNIFIALRSCKGNLIDLGSGDGRIVIEAAKKGFIAHGVELNPWLVIFSKLNSFKAGTSKTTYFFRKDLWKFSLNNYDNIIIFGVEQMMFDLERKLVQECSKDSKIIACRFPLPNITPKETIGKGMDKVWVYRIKK